MNRNFDCVHQYGFPWISPRSPRLQFGFHQFFEFWSTDSQLFASDCCARASFLFCLTSKLLSPSKYTFLFMPVYKFKNDTHFRHPCKPGELMQTSASLLSILFLLPIKKRFFRKSVTRIFNSGLSVYHLTLLLNCPLIGLPPFCAHTSIFFQVISFDCTSVRTIILCVLDVICQS